jgi:hypothetical protein
MKKNTNKSFTYHVGDIDEVIDSRGNSVIMLRKLAWGEGKENLELRKWVVDINKETPLKGCTFLTEEGPHNLTNKLVQLGYGHTNELLDTLSKRDDFKESLDSLGQEKTNEKSSVYYDPKEIIA